MTDHSVNHGAPIIHEQHAILGGVWASIGHDGPDGHDKLTGREQCECGVLATGITEPPRSPQMTDQPPTNPHIVVGAMVRLPHWPAHQHVTVTAVGQFNFLAEPPDLTHDLAEEAVCRLDHDWEPWNAPVADVIWVNMYPNGAGLGTHDTRARADETADAVNLRREAVAIRSSVGTWRIETP